MFPDAKFIHIHRHPAEVFQSFRHYYDTTAWFTYLQRPVETDFDQRIIRRYRELFDSFFEDRQLVPEGNFHEVAFTELEENPVSTIRDIYGKLNLPGIENALPKTEAYIAALRGYEKNSLPPLTEGERHLLREQWGHHYRRWGYEID